MHLLMKRETINCLERLVQADELDYNKTDFPKIKLTKEDYRQDKKLSGKTDKQADQYKDTNIDFPKNPN